MKTMENIKCVAGCKIFEGDEIKHHEDCPYYPESMSKIYNDRKIEVKNLRLTNSNYSSLFTGLQLKLTAMSSFAKEHFNEKAYDVTKMNIDEIRDWINKKYSKHGTN